MRRIPLALQVFLAVLFVLGIALGVGFYPSLIMEARQLSQERENSMINLANAVTLSVAAKARGEIDSTGYQSSINRLLSVPSVRTQIVSLEIIGLCSL